MTELIVAAEPTELARLATRWLAREMTSAIAERGSCGVCLAGGRTPEPVYRALAVESGITWERVDVFFTDERAVPPEHPDSNYRMVRQALLSRVPIPPARIHRMEAERADRDAAARDYAQALPDRLDVIVLGIGQDGHTASLFPRSSVMDERRFVVPVIGAKPPAERLTITPPVIERARRVAMIATGEDKAAIVARAVEGPDDPRAVPAQLARRGSWFLDEAAAAGLTTRKAGR